MEQTEYSQNLDQLNTQLKRQIQQTTKHLHLLIEQCLDKSEPQIQFRIPQKQISKRFHNLKPLQNLLKNQLSQIAIQTTQYNQSLLKISQKLIQKQLTRQQSNEMILIIKKYQEQLLPLRSQSVQKQNQYYYAYKSIYQSYQDSYYNCVPSVQRLSYLMRNYDIKQKIKQCCVELIKEKKQYQDIRVIIDENNKNQLNDNKQIMEVEEQQQELQMVMMQESSSQDKENCQNFTRNTRNKSKQQIRNQKGLKYSKVPFRNLQNLDNQIQKYKKTLMKFNSLDHQQTTTVSFKQALRQQQQQNIQQQNKNITSLEYIRRQKFRIPNFSHMSNYDYQLIKTYYSKIQRQEQRYEKFVEEYKNYKQVYEMLDEENKKFKKQLYERNNLRSGKQQYNDLEGLEQKVERQMFFEREQEQKSYIPNKNCSYQEKILDDEDILEQQNEIQEEKFNPDELIQREIIRSSNMLATDYFESSPDRFRNPKILCRKVQIHEDQKSPEGSNSLNQQFREDNSQNEERVIAISYNDEGSQFF